MDKFLLYVPVKKFWICIWICKNKTLHFISLHHQFDFYFTLITRSLSIDDSPRLDEVPKPRPRHKTDIFGKTDQVDVDLETDSPSASRLHRSGLGGRKTPTQVSAVLQTTGIRDV